jgi:hypothetical protein
MGWRIGGGVRLIRNQSKVRFMLAQQHRSSNANAMAILNVALINGVRQNNDIGGLHLSGIHEPKSSIVPLLSTPITKVTSETISASN